MPKEGMPSIEDIYESYYVLFIELIDKVLRCCHNFALDCKQKEINERKTKQKRKQTPVMSIILL